jgi:hypothetical protein
MKNFHHDSIKILENQQVSKPNEELKLSAVEIEEGMVFKSSLEEGWYGTSDSALLITKFLARECVSTGI